MAPARSPLEQLISEADHALRVLALPAAGAAGPPPAPPADTTGDTGTSPASDPAGRALAAALMRVNHAGEVAAQALYRGQALVARDPAIRAQLLAGADDEYAHLAWCEARVRELGSHTSLLAPAWYAASFAIGVLAGLAGDRASLGFIAETERQVAAHLDGHLERLPADDTRSRAIVAAMRADETRHGADARAAGGIDLPRPVARAMALVARVMTTVAHRV